MKPGTESAHRWRQSDEGGALDPGSGADYEMVVRPVSSVAGRKPAEHNTMISPLRAYSVKRLDRAEKWIAVRLARFAFEYIVGINQIDHGVTSLPGYPAFRQVSGPPGRGSGRIK